MGSPVWRMPIDGNFIDDSDICGAAIQPAFMTDVSLVEFRFTLE